MIQKREGRLLKDIIEEKGIEGFLAKIKEIEEKFGKLMASLVSENESLFS